jgi:hypothetical protein
MYAASKIARKNSQKTPNLKDEMYFATETRLEQIPLNPSRIRLERRSLRAFVRFELLQRIGGGSFKCIEGSEIGRYVAKVFFG